MTTQSLFKIEPKKRKKPKRFQVPFEKLRLTPQDEAVDIPYVNRLAGNIHIFSLMTPLIVQREKDHYVIRAGRRRYQALHLLREGGLKFHDGEKRITLDPQRTAFSKIDCMVYPELPQGTAARDAITLIENRLRKVNPLAELNALIGLRKKGIDEKQTFRLTGTPIPIQRKLLKLENLSDQMRGAVNDGKLSASNAQKIAELPRPKQKEVWQAFRNRVKETQAKREVITGADIQSVKRVAVQTAISSLPGSIFAPAPPARNSENALEVIRSLVDMLDYGKTMKPTGLKQWLYGTDAEHPEHAAVAAARNLIGDKKCPYCKAEVQDAGEDEAKFVNGIRPKDADATGCEFCNPTPSGDKA